MSALNRAGRKLNTDKILDAARSLRSEHGENREYDRALVELVTDILGLSMGSCPTVAEMIGVRWPAHRRKP